MKLGQLAQIAKGGNWVLSQYEDYLHHRDKNAELAALRVIMDTKERNREGTWSASASGSCLRQQQFTYLGMPSKEPEDKTLNIFANGDYVHLRHQAFGLVGGWITDTEVPVSDPELGLKGTMDGVLTNGAVLEIKSINSFGFSEVNTFGPKRQHIQQVHAYMMASNRVATHLIYECKNTNKLKEFRVPYDPEVGLEVVANLEKLGELTSKTEFAPMLDECKEQRGKYNWCPYNEMCASARWPGHPRLHILPMSSSDSD